MKTSKRNKLLCLALSGGFSLFGASNAFAAAGDTVSNLATLSYDVGTVAQTVIESAEGVGNSNPGLGNGTDTDFLEDRVINFTVTRENGAAIQVVPNSNQQAIPYLVDNTGNGTHGFLLAAVDDTGSLDPFGGAADSFTPTTIQTFVDVNDNGTFEPGTDNVAFIASLAPGAATDVRVFVIADIPAAGLSNDDIAVVSLVAQATDGVSTGVLGDAIINDDNSNFSPGGTFTNGGAVVPSGLGTIATVVDDPANMETVFNDGVFTDGVTGVTVDATGANDVAQNAQHSSYSSFIVNTAELTVSKDAIAHFDIINLNSSPKAIPGAVLRYTVTIANAAGAADATLTNVNDVLAMLMDTQFGDNSAANVALSGTDNVRITDGAGTVVFCLADNTDGNADGCTWDGTAGDTLIVDLTAVVGITNILSATESLTVEFDVIVP